MTEAMLRAWFDEIQRELPKDPSGPEMYQMPKFMADAESALSAAFPPLHPLLRQWRETHQEAMNSTEGSFVRLEAYRHMTGIFESGHHQLDERRRGDFTSVVRSAAENDLLGVAEELLDNKYPTASAAVTAGGALEVHLRGLCERQSVKWEGKDQIENYKAALEREHKADSSKGITTTDGKLVTGWGGSRNDAAHRPDEFSRTRTSDDVRAMITGVREFIARTT